MVTFAVDKVERSGECLATRDLVSAVHPLLFPEGGEGVVEATSARSAHVVPSPHGLVDAVWLAFDRHLPLVLSPDDVWLAVVQGFALARANEAPVADPKRLVVRRDDFVLGGDNPWPEVFESFGVQIRAHVGSKLFGLLSADFTTTGPVELAASRVACMGALKRLFQYEFMTLCGIPEITLLGTVADWHEVRRRASRLCALGMEGWQPALDDVLGHFVRAAEGRAHRSFWRSICKQNGDSGGPYITGWLNVFFPFQSETDRTEPNPWAFDWKNHRGWGGGIALDRLPSPLTRAPVRWRYLAEELDLTFAAGFVGVEQDAAGRLRPCIGWSVGRGGTRPARPPQPWPARAPTPDRSKPSLREELSRNARRWFGE